MGLLVMTSPSSIDLKFRQRSVVCFQSKRINPADPPAHCKELLKMGHDKHGSSDRQQIPPTGSIFMQYQSLHPGPPEDQRHRGGRGTPSSWIVATALPG